MPGLLDQTQMPSQGLLAPTPRKHQLVGLLADAIGAVDGFARSPFGYSNPPVALASDLLGIPAVQRTLDRISYGEPLTTGRGMTMKPRNDTTEAAMAVAFAPGAQKLARLFSEAPAIVKNAYKTDAYARVNGKIRGTEKLPERPFTDDYKSASTTGNAAAGERLAADMDGRPLTARYVAGRRVVGGPEEGLRPEDLSSIAQSLGSLRVVPKLPGRDVGRYTKSGGERTFELHQGLGPDEASQVLAHELGHAIDDIAGPYSLQARGGVIPPDGVVKDLARVYDDLNNRFGAPGINAPRLPKKQHTPAIDGYASPIEQDAERMAEAIRLYLENPGYIKSATPKLAARLREYVNAHPNLKDLIQLNSLAPIAVGSGSFGLLQALPESD